MSTVAPTPSPTQARTDAAMREIRDAQAALVRLQMRPADARAALTRALASWGGDPITVEELIRAALRPPAPAG